MATIDATIRGTASNSYVTLEEANNYFDERLHTEVWTNSTEDQKIKSLIMATRRINQEVFYGDRETATQRLPFPRVNLGYLDGVLLDGVIPQALKEAQCELAIHLLSVDMSKPSVDTSNIKAVKVGSISVDYAIDEGDNVSQSYDTLPPFVLSLLDDFSRTVTSGGVVMVGR